MVAVVLALAISLITHVAADTAASLASQYSLSTSTSPPFPTATLSSGDTQSHLKQEWSLAKGSIQQGGGNLAFVSDPFSSSNSSSGSSPVLQVTYPAGSFSGQTGGAQFVNLWNNSAPFGSMVLSYEIAFDQGFDFVKGGKLPGLRGPGTNVDDCSGGKASNGSNCFSARLMWRTNGAGEIYAYTPTNKALCASPGVQCNSDDFGTSIQRGKVSFLPGQWQKITLFIQMNNPVDTANGYMALYYNDVQAISQPGIQIRTSNSLGIAGMYFSTFFGGSDDSWATPNEVHTYFRNIQLYGGTGASTMQGSKVNWASTSQNRWSSIWVSGAGAALLTYMMF